MTQQVVCEARQNAAKESCSKSIKPVKINMKTISKSHKDIQ